MQVTEKQLKGLILGEEEKQKCLKQERDFVGDEEFQYCGIVSPAGGDFYGEMRKRTPPENRDLLDQLCCDLYFKGYERALNGVHQDGERKLKALLKELRKKKCLKKQGK